MPIVFWASFEPCEKAMNPADPTCSRRKALLVRRRGARRNVQYSTTISVNASANPITGEVTIGMRTLLTMPSTLNALGPAATSVAPNRPPIRAWLLELGSPKYHVSRFQAMAPISAAAITAWVVVSSSTSPEPIVLATAVPANAPMKLNDAAIAMACRGWSARVATDVAIALAVSWKPLM